MITDKDVNKLKAVFATKDDFKSFATKDDLKCGFKTVNKKLDFIIKYFDRDVSWHNRRLKQLEEKVGVKPPEYNLPPAKN